MSCDLDQNGFSYQIDLIVPNFETSFSDMKENLLKNHRYYLLAQIGLDMLLDKSFIETFLNKGTFCMLSYNTGLDLHDCACLLSSGKLILHLTESTYEKVPLNFNKKTSKSAGFIKYEVNICLKEIQKNPKNLALLKEIFSEMKFSFFTYWKPKQVEAFNYELEKKNLEAYFGEGSISECLNRVDLKVAAGKSQNINKFLNNSDLKIEENWIDAENFIGCLISDIDSEKIFGSESNTEENTSDYVSIFRMKSFMPNMILEEILHDYIGKIFANNESTKRVFVKLHGFHDSPVSLHNLSSSANITKIRVNEENFLSVCCQKGNESYSVISSLFRDFSKFYIIKDD